MQVGTVQECGILKEALPSEEWTEPSMLEGSPAADEIFAQLINQKLSDSTRKDIYIYVHGYKVTFENPLRRLGALAFPGV